MAVFCFGPLICVGFGQVNLRLIEVAADASVGALSVADYEDAMTAEVRVDFFRLVAAHDMTLLHSILSHRVPS